MIRQDQSVQKLIQGDFRKPSQITIHKDQPQLTLLQRMQQVKVENQKSPQKDQKWDLQAIMEAATPEAKSLKAHFCWDQDGAARNFQQRKN